MEKKNYYDWLEINRNASPEIIEKAYKTLVKKYHPDLQEIDNKTQSEEIIKKINEAYEVLSDTTKRQIYDKQIEDDTVPKEKYQELKRELYNLKNQTQNHNYEINNQKNYNDKININSESIEYKKKLENTIKKAYYDAYIQDLKNRGYKIKYKKTYKDYLRALIIIIIIIVVCVFIVILPITREKLIELYKTNNIIKSIVDIFGKILTSILS